MRALTHILNVDEASADRQTVIGPKNDNPDREDPPVVQSVMQLGINGCLTYCYITRMRIIRNNRPSVWRGNREGRLGSLAAMLAQFGRKAVFERTADVTESRVWWLSSRCLLSPIADVQ